MSEPNKRSLMSSPKPIGEGRSPHPGQSDIPARPQARTAFDSLPVLDVPKDQTKRVASRSLNLKSAETGTSGT